MGDHPKSFLGTFLDLGGETYNHSTAIISSTHSPDTDTIKSSQVKLVLSTQIQNSPLLAPGTRSLRRRQNLTTLLQGSSRRRQNFALLARVFETYNHSTVSISSTHSPDTDTIRITKKLFDLDYHLYYSQYGSRERPSRTFKRSKTASKPARCVGPAYHGAQSLIDGMLATPMRAIRVDPF